MPRKRTHDEMAAVEPQENKETPSLLKTIRNMWEFASTMQFIFMFGKALKIDEDFDIEDFETECLKPGHSEKLEEIGLTLLKWISSHRGLNHDIWDEYTRRQYRSKAPDRNPYGEDEEPKRFRDFDIFTRVRILHQLTVWTMWNPDRFREKMVDHQREVDQLEWRIEEFGYDKDDRQYYLLDDNRFYRRTEPPIPSAPKAKPKANSKKAIAARRRESKRRRLQADTPDVDEDADTPGTPDHAPKQEEDVDPAKVDTFGGYKWECIAISLKDYQDLCLSFAKSKDPNEKMLKQRIEDEVIPIIQQAQERQQRKIERRERELLMMERMVGAKRSGRLADKQDRERREAEQAEADRKRQAELLAAHREQEKQEKMEQERQYRMMTRERRIKEREYKRILKREELEKDAAEQRRIDTGEIRGSGRHLQDRIDRARRELEALSAEEEWTFDCSGCGKYGRNYDDGAHSVACDKCSVWQHSKCLGISKSAAEKDDFHFVCNDCKRKEEEAKRPKISLKFKVGSSSSPVQPSPARDASQTSPSVQKLVTVEIPSQQVNGTGQSHVNGVQQQSSSPPRHQPSSPFHPQTSPTIAQAQYQPMQIQQQHQQAPSRPDALNGHTVPNFNLHGNPGQSTGFPSIQPRPSITQPAHGNPPVVSPSSQHPYQRPPTQSTTSSNPPSQSSPQRPAHPSVNGQTPLAAITPRLPSPVLNRPSMSPTQGNMDVGSIAGVPQKQSSLNGHDNVMNGAASMHATPRSFSQSRSPPLHTPVQHHQPLSGLSPKKQMTPIPAPILSANLTVKKSGSMSPPPHLSSQFPPPQASRDQSVATERRSVSGTPIVPPIENLRPSPEQMRNMSSNINDPVPTPSKQQYAGQGYEPSQAMTNNPEDQA
ncbi:hypothetical protein PV10_08462 [Exophiala mesophila]|uniref:PHD-type domain-containing protein n=1 Tax=Exophiala mesophila TaxID=212818 RepID=A0A0D1Z4G9_EXOME|nr:uncharacterized protein PV10_08462 [Exophiala mesophila]KIV88824.1 hypothetical protein PV10_08462 [Exophiala mesophila]